MEFTVWENVDFCDLLANLGSTNSHNFHRNPVEKSKATAKRLHTKYLSVCMLHVVPIKPRKDCYWKAVHNAIITANFVDVHGKQWDFEDLLDIWKQHKKQVLQNLHCCKELLSDSMLIKAIDDLLKTFSKHWLSLHCLEKVGNNDKVDDEPPPNPAKAIARWNGFYAYKDHIDVTDKSAKPSSPPKKVKLDFMNFILEMDKSQPFEPAELSSWRNVLQQNANLPSEEVIERVAEDLHQTWLERIEIIVDDVSSASDTSSTIDSSYLTEAVLDDGADEKSVASCDSFDSVFSDMSPVDNAQSKMKGDKCLTGIIKLYPNFSVSLSVLLLAIQSTQPFSPSQQRFWVKVVNKITNYDLDLFNAHQLAIRLQCMWVLSKEGVSSVFGADSQLLFKSCLEFGDQPVCDGKEIYTCHESHNFNLSKHDWSAFKELQKDSDEEIISLHWSIVVLEKLHNLDLSCTFEIQSWEVFDEDCTNIVYSCTGNCKNTQCSLKFVVDIRKTLSGEIYFIHGASLCSPKQAKKSCSTANARLHASAGISEFTMNVLKPQFCVGKKAEVQQDDFEDDVTIGIDSEAKNFLFDKGIWKQMTDSVNKGNKLGCKVWKRYLLQVMKAHQPYCKLLFKHHWVYRNAYCRYLFVCSGGCKTADCELQFRVRIHNDTNLSSTVIYCNISKSSCKFAELN